MYNNEDFYSDEETDYTPDNDIVYHEDIYQFKIKQIENFKNLIYLEPEFVGIYNISSQEILNLIEATFNKYPISYKYNYNPTIEQFQYFLNIYNIIVKTYNFKNYQICSQNIYNLINIIYNKLYV